jgi:hypothetical protein
MRIFDLRLQDNDSKWHNYASPLNVDGDQGISPLDVLAIVNYLNSNLSKDLFTATVTTPPTYIDTDDDQTVSPLDVLLVINFLNNKARGAGEGEANSLAVDWSTTGVYSVLNTNEETLKDSVRLTVQARPNRAKAFSWTVR